MKKILFIALALIVTGTAFADKKCCKDKASCKKEASSKSCSHDAKAEGTAAVNAAPAEETHACCKKSAAAGGKACCAKGGHADSSTPKTETPAKPEKKD